MMFSKKNETGGRNDMQQEKTKPAAEMIYSKRKETNPATEVRIYD